MGIENTERGRDLTGSSKMETDSKYCPISDGAMDFRAFIKVELMPEINKRYKTTGYNGIIGESLDGLFVIETFLVAPASFDFYITMDPSLWWNDHYLEKEAETYLEKLPNKEVKLWFTASSAEDISKHSINLAKKLNNFSPQNIKWIYSNQPTEKHNTIFRATKDEALIWSLN